MKRKNHTEAQIVKKLQEAEKLKAEGKSTPEIAKLLGVSQATFYKWKNAYSGIDKNALKELKALQKENEKLKHLVADKELDILMLKEIASGNF
jgi:putative transposase